MHGQTLIKDMLVFEIPCKLLTSQLPVGVDRNSVEQYFRSRIRTGDVLNEL